MEKIEDVHYRAGSGTFCNLGYHYLASPTRIYFGMVQQDGKFVVYRGASPEDQHDALWSTGVSDKTVVNGARDIMLGFGHPPRVDHPVYARVVAAKNDRFFDLWKSSDVRIGATDTIKAVVEDDGNFCIFSLGEGQPKSAAKALWKSNVTDPVVEYDMSKITYDLTAAQILDSEPVLVMELQVENDTTLVDFPVISQTFTKLKTTGWTNALAIEEWKSITGSPEVPGKNQWFHLVKIDIKVTAKTGVPIVNDKGAVELSTEMQNTYTWNKSDTVGENFTFTAPLALWPRERGKVVVTATKTHITVPYSGTGELLFKSGKRCSRRVEGMYKGANVHSLKAVYKSEKNLGYIPGDPTIITMPDGDVKFDLKPVPH